MVNVPMSVICVLSLLGMGIASYLEAPIAVLCFLFSLIFASFCAVR